VNLAREGFPDGETDAEEQFNDEMDDMKIEDAEFDSDEGELHADAEMEDTEIKGAEQPGLDSDEEAYELDEIEEYGYDGIEEIEESDENEDKDGGDDGGATSKVDDAVLGAKDGEDDEDEADDYGEL
jgi:hypothetical protein